MSNQPRSPVPAFDTPNEADHRVALRQYAVALIGAYPRGHFDSDEHWINLIFDGAAALVAAENERVRLDDE